jgi:hypothetical protein
MKKALLASAVSLALLGMTGCSDQNSTAATAAPVTQSQSASAQFVVNFPEAEASAALIPVEAVSIELSLLPASVLVSALEQCLQTGSWPSYCVGEQLYQLEFLYQASYQLGDLVQRYNALTPDANQALQFSHELQEILKPLIEHNVFDALDLEGKVIERSLTRQNNTANITSLFTGLYLIMADQRDAESQRIAYETMAAFLGEGNNAIALNMMSGSWTVVNALGQPAARSFNLLGSELAASWDWDKEAEGNQNVIQSMSEGDANSAALAGIHYLNHGYPGTYGQAMPVAEGEPTERGEYAPVNFLFDLLINGNQPELVRQYNDMHHYQDYGAASAQSDYSYNASAMDALFHQIYDARLEGDKTLQGGLFNLELEMETANYEMEAGAFILDAVLPQVKVNNDGSGNREYYPQGDGTWQYQSYWNYTNSQGEFSTLYYVTSENAEFIWKSPTTDANLAGLTPMKVVGGNRVNGYLVEFMSRLLGSDTSPATTDAISANTPTQTQAMMVLAMGKLAQEKGLSASAAHQLGAQCAYIDELIVDNQITYGWVNEQWRAGSVNWTYNAQNIDGQWVVGGVDMNGNGTVEVFEEGVVENWGQSASNCGVCEGDSYYRIVQRNEDGVLDSSYAAYAYITDADLADGWVQALDGFENPMFGVYDREGVRIYLNVEWIYVNDNWEQQLARYYVNDLDGDGTVEFFENVGGKAFLDRHELHVCYQPIRLDGAALQKTKDDFLYEELYTIDLSTKSAVSEITTSFCTESIKGGWQYTFGETQLTLTGSDSFDESGGFDNCVVGQQETIELTVSELLAEFDIPFNCAQYPVCTLNDLNKTLEGVDQDERSFVSTYQYDIETQVLTYTKTLTADQSWFREVIVIE